MVKRLPPFWMSVYQYRLLLPLVNGPGKWLMGSSLLGEMLWGRISFNNNRHSITLSIRKCWVCLILLWTHVYKVSFSFNWPSLPSFLTLPLINLAQIKTNNPYAKSICHLRIGSFLDRKWKGNDFFFNCQSKIFKKKKKIVGSLNVHLYRVVLLQFSSPKWFIFLDRTFFKS